ncbi:type II toxin-antitoxin system PrlF family antitoxin [Pseudomonas sp. Lb2C1-1]|uniref:type II toxin-antitoxin system PrlF family antitoxin n=1 Tax=Pseudomonas TaxID=286 RepID=UPI0009A44D00|nr:MULTISPECIES: type II toxin-antitoxin system PrlF family antitoxin [Pseudomonas]OPG72287.1 hypothetical protein B1219_19340 [Pseudomonas ogarae]OPG81304.1 hypothetical protein B1218_00440 [Pseudomonas ogarae]QXH97720.1 hypothetical protein HU749_015800 [Pseudomonas zarinae]
MKYLGAMAWSVLQTVAFLNGFLFKVDRSRHLEGIEPSKEDCAVFQMLDFLAADILHRPEQLQSLNWELIARITTLVGDVEVDRGQ